MAAPNLTLSRPGVINDTSGTWADDNALFLKVFSGEVINAFERACIFKQFVMKRSIESGRSAQFPVTGRFTAKYHTPGSMIVGQGNMAQNEVVIRIDDLLIADASLYDLDQAKSHVDMRQIYSKELGEAMAREYDKRVARVATLGARVTAGDLAADLPPGLSPDDPYRTGTRIDLNNTTPTPDDYVAALFAAAQALDEKDVPSGDRHAICSPDVYYTLVQSSRAVNQDFNRGDNGSYSSGDVARLAGFTIHSSNHIKQGDVTAKAGEQGQVFNGNTVLSTVDMTQTRMICMHSNSVGVLSLRDMAMQMTGNDYNVMYQAVLLVARYALGFGYLRPEGIVEVYNSQSQ